MFAVVLADDIGGVAAGLVGVEDRVERLEVSVVASPPKSVVGAEGL